MKQVTLKRDVLVPDTGYCIQWKGGEVCPFLHYVKIPKSSKIINRCAFFDISLFKNVNSIGIKKHCEKLNTDSKVFTLDGSKINLK